MNQFFGTMKNPSKLKSPSSLRKLVSAQRDPSKSNPRSNTAALSTEIKGDDWAVITASSEPPSLPKRPPTVNVVLFGETGVGKSSVINLIAQQDVARVSSDVNGCTMQSTRYDIPFDNMVFSIFDTIGLEEPQMGVNGYLKAIEKAYELIVNLGAAGGIHLLLFCMRGGRITATTQSNYRLFCECLCSKKVPIALVFTGLEREVEMENWWKRNETYIAHYGIKSDGHACITAVRDDTPEEDLKYMESQRKIRELLITCALKNEAFSLETLTWFARVGNLMRTLIKKQRVPGKKNVMRVLTQRCKLDPDTARRIMEMMEKSDVKTEDGNKDVHPKDGPDERGKSGGAEEDQLEPGGQAPVGQQVKAEGRNRNRNPEEGNDSERPVESGNDGHVSSEQMGSEETKSGTPGELVETIGEDRSQQGVEDRNEGGDDRTKHGSTPEDVHCADDNVSGYQTATQQDDTEDELLTGGWGDFQRSKENKDRGDQSCGPDLGRASDGVRERGHKAESWGPLKVSGHL